MEDEGKGKEALRGRLLEEYLRSGYKAEGKQHEIVIDGAAYKAMERREITAFYDASGNTLFNISNEQVKSDYESMLRQDIQTCAMMEQIKDTDLPCYGGLGDKCSLCGRLTEDNLKEEIGSEAGEDTEMECAGDDKEGASTDMAENAKSYSSGEEKLIAEEGEMIASAKPEFRKAMKAQMDLIFKELVGWTKRDPEFEERVLLSHKSMKRCMKFCADKALGLREPSDQEKADARNNNIPIMTPVGSDMLLEWIKEYYDKDDKDEAEKEEKRKAAEKERKAEADKKAKARKAAAEEKKKEREEKKKAEAARKKEKAKASAARKNEMEGQVSIFDMMGA